MEYINIDKIQNKDFYYIFNIYRKYLDYKIDFDYEYEDTNYYTFDLNQNSHSNSIYDILSINNLIHINAVNYEEALIIFSFMKCIIDGNIDILVDIFEYYEFDTIEKKVSIFDFFEVIELSCVFSFELNNNIKPLSYNITINNENITFGTSIICDIELMDELLNNELIIYNIDNDYNRLHTIFYDIIVS